MTDITAARRTTYAGLSAAVHRNKALSRGGLLERLFTVAFRGLVYPQIWEDPLIDMEALRIGPDDHIVTIASGGCNVLSYLTASPRRITAVDLNNHHVALNRLKLCAARHLPHHTAFFNFFGRADAAANVSLYDTLLRDHLDATTRAYWDRRDHLARRRITLFRRDFYRHGLLGRFIGAAHRVARLHGRDPRLMTTAATLAEQRTIFARELAPLLGAPLVRWFAARPASLYGLGIPPSQYRSLAASHGDGIVATLGERLERLACDFPLAENYFAWQAFGRAYAPGPRPSVPPYLEERWFEAVKARSSRVDVRHASVTAVLEASAAESVDAFVLLDAQDWMTDEDLTALWRQIARTAKPGARVIFRTAGIDSILPGRVPEDILARWSYDAERCREFTRRDRSSIYGGFHLYELRSA